MAFVGFESIFVIFDFNNTQLPQLPSIILFFISEFIIVQLLQPEILPALVIVRLITLNF